MRLETLSDRIDAGVLAAGVSQAEIARRAGLPTRQTISRMKSGAMVGRPHLESLARELRCSVEWLTTGNGDPPTWATPSDQAIARRIAETATAYDPATAAEAMRALARENARHRDRIAELTGELELAQSALAAHEARNSTLLARLAEVEAMNSNLRDRIASLEARKRSPHRRAQ